MGEPEVERAGRPGQAPKVSRARATWGVAAVVLVAVAVFGVWLVFSGAWKAWGAVASLDGTRITRAELDQHVDFLVKQGRVRPEDLADPARRKDAERAVLDDLITRRLLVAEARRLKIAVEPGEEDQAFRQAHGAQAGGLNLLEAAKKAGEDVERLRQEMRGQLLMRRLAEKVTEGVTVADADVVKYYEAHPQAFVAPGAARLRLLVVDSREEAERLRGQALEGADFAALVRQFSTGRGKDNGGDMGWVDPRILPASIAKAVAAIPQTGITPVIEGKGSFYVLRVEARRASRQVSLEEARDRIKETLTGERKQAKFAEWLEERRRASRIERYP